MKLGSLGEVAGRFRGARVGCRVGKCLEQMCSNDVMVMVVGNESVKLMNSFVGCNEL